MARTWQEIYDEMTNGVQAVQAFNALLPSSENVSQFLIDIKSKSKIATWRAYFFCVSVFHYKQELRVQDAYTTLEKMNSEGQYGTAPWWEKRALDFQDGHLLIETNGSLGYETIDETAKIITVSAVSRLGGSIEIKVAKGSITALQPLSFAEKAGLISYVNKIKPVGENVLIVSELPDLLKLSAELYYRATAGLTTVKSAVETEINKYLAELQFGGVFVTNTLIDRIQGVSGVVDVKLTQLEAKPNSGGYSIIDRIYPSNAGYMQIDPNHTLANNITYIAS